MENNAIITTKSSAGDNYSYVLPVTTTACDPPGQSSPKITYISGSLPGGRKLTHPIEIWIEYDDDEVVVSEPLFHMHASASTEMEALAAFRRIFSGYLDILAPREKTLGPQLREQLEYLRSSIASE